MTGVLSMADYIVELVDSLPDEVEEKMSQGLIAYESTHGIDVNYARLSVLIRSESDEVIGVLKAYTAYSEIYVDDLWVDSARRRQGIGRRLVQELERRFENQGFNNINLVTSAFNAPEFYRKLGYSEEFTRENKYNPKLSKTFFVKFFEDVEQTQGLIK
jgi:ribosomal protein S18 acetylase RimI-like enzyme